MKRALFFIAALLTLATAAYGALPRIFMLYKLGASTRAEVSRQLELKTFTPKWSDDGTLFCSFYSSERPVIDENTPKIYGTLWHSALYKFNYDGGKLSDIYFQKTYDNPAPAKSDFDAVKKYLREHFPGDFLKNGQPVDREDYRESESVFYHSGNVTYKLFYGEANGLPILVLWVYYRN